MTLFEKFIQDGLTEKQAKAACLVIDGKDNEEIAIELGLLESGVKFRLTDVYLKLNVKGRSQLMAKYMRPIYENTNN